MEGGQMKKERDRHAHDTEVFSDIFWILSKEEPKHEPKKRNMEQMKNSNNIFWAGKTKNICF